jgi:uncharacterized protein (PEP-CTERM system associated)
LTPWRRLYLSSTLTYQETRLVTSSDFSPVVVPFRGHVYSVLGGATYALSPTADLQATYSFSTADYTQTSQSGGLALGVDYRRHALEVGLSRRFGKNLTTQLKYGFYRYDDTFNAGADNYRAHALIASVAIQLP